MPSFCCFVCPEEDYSERDLAERCSSCGNQFGFPLFIHPETIRNYRVLRPIARGFYAATYVAEYGALAQQCVLRVTSKAIYQFFNKNFTEECKLHAQIAKNSEHIVPIRDMFDQELLFGDLNVDCHVAVLDMVEGKTLSEHLTQKTRLQARAIAQIGIDLFRIINELEQREIHHNDLRGDNIIIRELGESLRVEAIDDTIRAVVVDLGSVAGGSISNDNQPRLGDIHWVANHLKSLAEHLLKDPAQASDLDYRLASLLDERAHLLSPIITNQRRPSTDECINHIKDAFQQVLSPWQEQLKLKRFDDAYNAQTLEPWFVPLLLVDPDEEWRGRMSASGPQVITGMRGCGKTMLLRSLQFHARATREENESAEEVLSRLRKDQFVGLYVSCTRLLDYLGSPRRELKEPYPRLLVAYGLEALRAVRHLREISPESVSRYFYRDLGKAIDDYLASPYDLARAGSEYELERRLIQIQISLTRGAGNYLLKSHPSIAFPHLAGAITKCSELWTGHDVLFLLDDVSTRYIHQGQVEELLSKLLFQHEECAFKLTTEAQTLEIILRSPGKIEKARLGRDYDVFDLGAEVYDKVRHRRMSSGKIFVENILARRAKYYPHHPNAKPRTILGDTPLSLIAQKIVTTSQTSRAKKEIYHGLSALTGVCVGDIGDVISIYELILKRAEGNVFNPVAANIQSSCYQDFCSRRLFDLNRRENRLKVVALSFAEASHELLIQSFHARRPNTPIRLRQYAKVYVRITTGDPVEQFERLRTLIDSGVFILAGGSDTPRTKTRDSNPIQQFVLTFRRLFGLSNFIGLAERDRFELSGKDLEEWLLDPEQGKEILMRNLQQDLSGEDSESDDFEEEEIEGARAPGEQTLLFSSSGVLEPVFTNGKVEPDHEFEKYLEQRTPESRVLMASQLRKVGITEAVLGLGFEKRCLESAKRLAALLRPQTIKAIRYSEAGHTEEILSILNAVGAHIDIIDYADVLSNGLEIRGNRVFIDTSGLAKPAIFHAIRGALKTNRRVWWSDTRAKTYYPLEEDILRVLEAEHNRDHYALLEQLGKILSGETGHFVIERLLYSDADESRRRVLCAFSSSKHGRLMKLLDERDYDRIEILVPPELTPRSQLAAIAADFAVHNYPGSTASPMDSHDLEGVLKFLMERYQKFYVDGGFNVELALTGSKLQAVACAAVSAAVKISQCWYVHAQQFDINRFTKGSGPTTFYEISIQ